jgi:hypothetical protein
MAARWSGARFPVSAALLALAALACLAPPGAAAEAAEKKAVTLTLKISDPMSGFSLEAHKIVPPDANAFDVLRHTVSVAYKTDAALGPVVTGLCGVTAPKGFSWALYVDGEPAKAGVGGLTLKKSTLIEWKIEKGGSR